MAACCLIGTGTAIFKPPLHGTLAHCVDEKNSSLGWGLFYQVVNIGGFVGPLVCGYLRLLEWRYAFFAASGIILINVFITIFFLKDYARRDAKIKGPGQVFADAMGVFRDVRFVVFLGIFSGFWFMFMQLSDQLAVFINQWVDSRDVASFLTETLGLHFLRDNFTRNAGQVNPEWLTDIDAFSIIILVVPLSYLSGRFRHITVMIFGMFVSCIGMLMAGSASAGWPVSLAIFIFAVGEMICSPKFSEYIGLMAPPEKKALYMGYSNIPFAVGWSGANFVGGPLYEYFADKHALARYYLTHVLGQDSATVAALPKGEILPTLATALNKTEIEVQHLLWNQYHPPIFFYLVIAVGLAATLAMVGYHFWLLADTRKRAAA
jgi:dipeptide/tripeptide permease